MTRTLLFAAVAVAPVLALDRCVHLDDASTSRLSEFVRGAFRVEKTTTFDLQLIGRLGESCVLEFLVSTVRAGRPVKQSVYLSEDRRYLFRAMLDTASQTSQPARGPDLSRLASAGSARTGPPDSERLITVFTDYQCPFCREADRFLREELMRPENAGIAIVWRQFPLAGHDWAAEAAKAALCAFNQGQAVFNEVNASLFALQKQSKRSDAIRAIYDLPNQHQSLKKDPFLTCLEDEKTTRRLDEDLKGGTGLEIEATPTVFVGHRRLSPGLDRVEFKTILKSLTALQ